MAEAKEPILTLTEDDVETKYNVNELSEEAKVIYNKLSDLQRQHGNIVVMANENQILQNHYINLIKSHLPTENKKDEESKNTKGSKES